MAFELARGGKALAAITVASGASEQELYAAGELRDYLCLISGAAFEVESEETAEKRVCVGRAAKALLGKDISFGEDAFRLYEMFMGAFDQAIPWSTNGAKGCRKFLDRVWRLQEIMTEEKGYSPELNSMIHETIKKVSEDYEKMKYNTAIAAMMTLVNEMYAKGSVTKDELEALILILSPVAPHICEEIWQNLGHDQPIHHQKWPAWDEEALKKQEVEIAIQINGKVKGRIMIPADLTRESAEKELPDNADVQRLVNGRTIAKIIFVPGRLLNIVCR